VARHSASDLVGLGVGVVVRVVSVSLMKGSYARSVSGR
jgi:hypothetical protein